MSHAVYLLVGDEFLVDEALERIREEAGAEPLAEATFDAASDAAAIVTALETRSLLGGRRLVIVEGAGGLRAEQAKRLEAYLEAPAPDSVLVLVASSKTRLEPIVRRSGIVVALEPPRGRQLADWIRRRAAAHDLHLDERGAWALADSVGSDLRALDGALEQLATGLGKGARAGQADVRRAFPRLADERMYAFTDAVGDRRMAAAMTALRRLLEQGDEPLVVLGALAAHVRRLIRARAHAETGARRVAEVLGLPGWRAERLARQARAYREDELPAALVMLAEADVAIKGGDMPAEPALERAVVRMIRGIP